MQAHLVQPLSLGDQGQKGQCLQWEDSGYGRRHREGPMPWGSALSWGASRTHRQPKLTARGKVPQTSLSREPRAECRCAGHVFN